MKKILLLLIVSQISFAQLVKIEPDSIVDTSDFIESGKYDLYMDSVLVSPHNKYIKAAIKAGVLHRMNPDANIEVRPVIGRPTGSFEIYVDQSKLNNSVNLDSVYGSIDHLKQTIAFQAEVINNVYTIELPKRDAKIDYLDSLNRKKIDVLKNRIEVLETFIKDSIAFISEPPIDYSLPIIKGFSYDTTGWQIDTENELYTYLDETDTRYIVFDFNRELVVGETYRVSFDIVSNGNANFSIWLYAVDTETPPDGFENSRVSNELSFTEGSRYFDYTVEYLNRESLGIRARTSGWGFTMSNIKIEKL